MELIKKNSRTGSVILIDGDNNSRGEITLTEAFNIADDYALDVVQVDYKDDVMVCKLLDWGKIRYNKQKKKQQTKRKRKEVTIKGNIAPHDLERKIKDVNRFIGSGNDVSVTIVIHRYSTSKQELIDDIISMLPIAKDTTIESVNLGKRLVKFRGKEK